jgi:hypothetical protein
MRVELRIAEETEIVRAERVNGAGGCRSQRGGARQNNKS